MAKYQAKMTRVQIVRSGHLLNMQYTITELAEEIGVTYDAIRQGFLKMGCPHTKEAGERGRVWINGAQFHTWAVKTFTRKPKASKLPAGHAHCFRCKEAVEIQNPQVKRGRGVPFDRLSGTCPKCGTVVNRSIKRAKP